VTTRLKRSQQNLESLNGIITQFEKRLTTVPGAELGLTQLSRESEVYGRLYSYLLERQQQTAIVKASTISKNRILDEPEEPHREASPRLALRLASLPLGILVGVALVLLRGLVSGVFQGESDIKRSLGTLPVFASVPRYHPRRKRGSKAEQEPIFDPQGDLDVDFVEAFRTLRASLYSSFSNGMGGVILVTSPCPEDGKTTCVLALASLLAADGRRVLLVDADLRAPTHHALIGSHPDRDLGSVLNGNLRLRDAVWPVHVARGLCHSLGARDSLSVELLSSEGMRRLLLDARAAYDFVLIDAPSMPVVSDALVLAPQADCILSVIRPQHTRRRVAQEHIERLYALTETHAAVINDLVPNTRASRRRRPSAPEARRSPATQASNGPSSRLGSLSDSKSRPEDVTRDPRLVPTPIHERSR
jgi:Mrp family chromosome partitioning ATPase